jgi:acyl-CoA thioester hydrolase
MSVDVERMIDVDFRRSHRVRWRETDASGFVHFSNYIRMMEETEYAFLRSLNLSIVMRDEKGVVGFPRVSTEVEVHNPARWDDELDIWLQVSGSDGVKIGYRFEIANQSDVVATGKFLLACCRFPPGEPPRAILVPDFFLNRFPRIEPERKR